MPPLSVRLSPLLTANVIETLARQGIKTVAGYVDCELVPLAQTTGLPYKLLTSIQQSLLVQFAALPTTAADLWHAQEKTAAILPTGCSNVDELLDGGVMTGELTELTGVPSSGKTQLCYSLAVAAVLHTNSSVLWVDSSGGFCASRLLNILTANGATEEVCVGLMERIRVRCLFNLFDLLDLLEDVSKQVSNQSDWFHTNLHLLLLDSVTPLLSPLLGSPGGQGHALLSHLASSLRHIAYEHSMAVVYTNNTVSNMTSGGGVKPSLGRSWSYVPHTRISLSPSSHPHTLTTGQQSQTSHVVERVTTLTKSSRLGVNVCTSFSISDQGLLPTQQ